jgi:hypothetical protein
MKLVILCQEEPIFLGPFIQALLRQQPERVSAVLIAGNRKAGERVTSWWDALKALYIYWLILEPVDFCRVMWRRCQFKFAGPSSALRVAGLAKTLGIPVYPITNPNSPECHDLLKQLAPDVVLNQSELLLKPEVLAIPKRGFINRHASLLPQFRGRLASFWSHAATPPQYGITIHFVDAGVDSGEIILKQDLSSLVQPHWPYLKVMITLMQQAPTLFWQALTLLEQPDFSPQPNHATDTPYKFPTLEAARAYRQTMQTRRRQHV